MILKIVDIKNPILRKKAKPVPAIDKKIKKLISDMKETLLSQADPEGVGLAAPQVGKSLQIFLMHYPEEKIEMKTVINPQILKITKSTKTKSKSSKNVLEGCLSIPYYYGPVTRPSSITLSYQDEFGIKRTEIFKDFAAHIVAHEMEHLEGILFIDHIIKNNSPLYKIKGDEYEEVEI